MAAYWKGRFPHLRSILAELASQHGFDTGQELWLYLYISEAWEDAKRGRISPDDFWRERLAGLGITEYRGFREALFTHRSPNPKMTETCP